MKDEGGRRKSDKQAGAPALARILIVDDDEPYLKYAELALRRGGFDVSTARDGKSAIAALRKDRDIQLVLIDLAMPMMDGIETFRHIQEQEGSGGLYTILLTGHSESETKLRAFDSGFDDFLSKTEPEEEILAKLRSAARRLEMERQLHLENEQLQTLAFTDELTGISNRRALRQAADSMIGPKTASGVILFDLDHFKDINDTHGHAMGDAVLVGVANCLKAKTRLGDVIARHGGDEFVVLLAGASEQETRTIAARIAIAISGLEWHSDREAIRVEASYGIAAGTANLVEALQKCDAQMYVNKRRRGGPAVRTIARPGRARLTT